jgi:hypothetical protein
MTTTTTNNTYKVGDLYTSTRSGVTGTIEEIVIVRSDRVKVRLNVEGKSRWTTWTPPYPLTK